jgi:hypothetical protein
MATALTLSPPHQKATRDAIRVLQMKKDRFTIDSIRIERGA